MLNSLQELIAFLCDCSKERRGCSVVDPKQTSFSNWLSPLMARRNKKEVDRNLAPELESQDAFSCAKKIQFVKWRILSRPGKIGTGKNTKYIFLLLGLKYTLRTCFESKNFSSNSCPELSNQVLSFSACQIC